MKDKIFSYGLVMRKRFTEKQKMRYLYAIQTDLEKNNVSSSVMRSDLKLKMNQSITHYNLYVGDVSKADLVIATYYDTGRKNFLSKGMNAFDLGLSKLTYALQIGCSLFLLLCLSLINLKYFAPRMSVDSLLSLNSLVFLIVNIFGLWLITKVGKGFPNKRNLVRNTSSVLALIELIHQKDYPNVAFAFVDGGTSTNYGLQMLNLTKKSKTPLVYLDAIGNKGEIVIYSKFKNFKNRNVLNVSDNDLADVLITFGDVVDDKVFVPNANTSKDIELSEDILSANIKILKEHLKQLI